MQKDDFNSVGITPPRGRQGHSVPTPKPLGMEIPISSGVNKVPSSVSNQPFAPSKLDSWPTTDLQHSGSSSGNSSGCAAISPAQFYTHRDHAFGGSLSKLDRMRSHPDSFYMEAFDEAEENESPHAKGFSKDTMGNGSASSPPPSDATPPPAVSRMSTSGGRGGGTNMSLDKLTGDSLLFFSYSAAAGGAGGGLNSDSQLGGSFVRAFTQGLSTSLSVPYFPCTSPVSGGPGASGDQSHLFPTAARNPNKAIITIDARSSRILVANEMTCELFGYQRNELSGMKIQHLFTEPYRGKQRALMEQNISASGETVLISGKVMDALTSYGIEFPVSVWMRRVGKDKASPTSADSSAPPQVQAPPTPRVIVVIEPVERSSAVFAMDSSHRIASCDPWFACLFGFQESSEVIGRPVSEVIPSLKLPEGAQSLSDIASKQAVTGRAKDGTVFPLTVKFTDVSQTSLSISDLYSPVHTRETSSTNDSSRYPADSHSSGFSPLTSDPDPTSLSSAPSSVDPSPSVLTPPSVESSSPSLVTPPSTASASDSQQQQQPSPSLEDPSPLPSSSSSPSYVNAKVIVYAALSGMISFFLDGTIHGCNHHFALMLFGYTQQELQKKDITFLLPDFYQHIGFIDDRSMPLPPVDEEDDDLFHSVAERSFSPDRASEFLKNLPLQEGLSPSRAKQQLHLSPKRHASPLRSKLPATAEVEEEAGEEEDRAFSSSMGDNGLPGSTTTSKSVGQSASGDPSLVSCDPSQKSHDPGDSSMPSVPPADSNPPSLPPVPNRLVPSRSTERIMELLNQHDMRKQAGMDSSTEERKPFPLASTPSCSRTQAQDRLRSQNSQDYDRLSLGSQMSIQDGTFLGDARHKDGSLMAVVFQLKRIVLADGQEIYCMWLSRDLDMERARTADFSMSMNRPPDPYKHRVMISPEVDVKGGVESTDGRAKDAPSQRRSSGGVGHTPFPAQTREQQQQQTEEVLAMEGEYSLNYNTLRPIGKGAFGFVRLAQRIKDESMVVVKFLRKSSVLKDCWIEDHEMGRVPLEIALLARLSHCNIVQLLEAYENEHFFQMVMEKHGEGLDLFEFIERGPRLAEQHISFVFRQMISALDYLHSKDIVHRDIKDENIIIDQRFNIKLIDFGSAAYMAPGKLFNTFCGTLEYCSPEVLLGNSYAGPELEMWAVGVTLYTLVFSENPFFDVEETISGHLQPPFLTSPALMKVLFWLLHPDPRSRATIRDLQKDKWTNQPLDDSLLNFDCVFGQVTEDIGNECNSGGVAKKTNSEGGATQLSTSMLEQLVVSDKGVEQGGGAWS